MKEDVTQYVLGGGALGCFLLAVEIFKGTVFPDVDALWGIPLLIIALILFGSAVQRSRKRFAQRTKKLKNLAEEMGMEFSAKGDSASRESLPAFDLLPKRGVKRGSGRRGRHPAGAGFRRHLLPKGEVFL